MPPFAGVFDGVAAKSCLFGLCPGVAKSCLLGVGVSAGVSPTLSRLLACFGAGVLQEGVSVFTVPGVVGGRLLLLVPSSMPVLGLAATLATEDASCLRRIAASGAFCAACTTGLVYVLISPAM